MSNSTGLSLPASFTWTWRMSDLSSRLYLPRSASGTLSARMSVAGFSSLRLVKLVSRRFMLLRAFLQGDDGARRLQAPGGEARRLGGLGTTGAGELAHQVLDGGVVCPALDRLHDLPLFRGVAFHHDRRLFRLVALDFYPVNVLGLELVLFSLKLLVHVVARGLVARVV